VPILDRCQCFTSRIQSRCILVGTESYRLVGSPTLGHIAHQTVFTLFPTLSQDLAPYVYRAPDAIGAELSCAGLDGTYTETFSGVSRADSASDVAYATCQGGVMRSVVEPLGPGRLDEATEAVTRAVAARFGDGPFEAPNRALLVTAKRPGR
jgi:hypothetical protein